MLQLHFFYSSFSVSAHGVVPGSTKFLSARGTRKKSSNFAQRVKYCKKLECRRGGGKYLTICSEFAIYFK